MILYFLLGLTASKKAYSRRLSPELLSPVKRLMGETNAEECLKTVYLPAGLTTISSIANYYRVDKSDLLRWNPNLDRNYPLISIGLPISIGTPCAPKAEPLLTNASAFSGSCLSDPSTGTAFLSLCYAAGVTNPDNCFQHFLDSYVDGYVSDSCFIYNWEPLSIKYFGALRLGSGFVDSNSEILHAYKANGHLHYVVTDTCERQIIYDPHPIAGRTFAYSKLEDRKVIEFRGNHYKC